MISQDQQIKQSPNHQPYNDNKSYKNNQNQLLVQKINQNSPHQNIQLSKSQSLESQQQSQQSHHEPIQQTLKSNELGKSIIKFPKSNPNAQKYQNKQLIQQIKNKMGLQVIYPWLTQKTKSIQNPLIKLHNQVIDYYLAFQQCQQTHHHLLFTFNKLQGLLFKSFRNCDVLAPFLVNRVYLKNSEIQIFILFDSINWKSPETIQKVRQCLQKMNLQQIKFFESNSAQGKQQKIGFNCQTQQKGYPIQIKLATQQWISYLSMIQDVIENNLESKYLHLIFQTMVRQRGLQNVVKGYLVFGLISVFLQQRRRQKSRSLTQNLLKFLQYFGIGPFTERKISYVGRNQFQIVQSPVHPNNPLSSQFSFWISPTIDVSNHMVRQFFSLLRNRYRLVSNFNFAKSQSVLAILINPIYDQFRY